MIVAVDAHALLWWLSDDRQLSAAARSAIADAEEPLVGAGTLVEIAVKRSLGKLRLDPDWTDRTREDGFRILDVSWSHAARLRDLPFVTVDGKTHRDPFDRLLVSQALVERIPVVTRDPLIAAYGVPIIW